MKIVCAYQRASDDSPLSFSYDDICKLDYAGIFKPTENQNAVNSMSLSSRYALRLSQYDVRPYVLQYLCAVSRSNFEIDLSSGRMIIMKDIAC